MCHFCKNSHPEGLDDRGAVGLSDVDVFRGHAGGDDRPGRSNARNDDPLHRPTTSVCEGAGSGASPSRRKDNDGVI